MKQFFTKGLGCLALLIMLTAVNAFAGVIVGGDDQEPPFVVYTIPEAEQTGVSPGEPVMLLLSDSMPGEPGSGVNPETVELYINEALVEPWMEGHGFGALFLYYEHEPFEEGPVYVTVSACDNAGNCMEPYEYWFEVGNGGPGDDTTPPYVLETHPEDGQIGVPPDHPITAIIGDMVWGGEWSGVDLESVELFVNEELVEVEIFEHYHGSVEVFYEHEAPFEEGSTVYAALNACDMAGNCMETYEFMFSIHEGGGDDTTPPFVMETHPPDGATDVNPGHPIMALISDMVWGGEWSGVDPDTIELYVNDEQVDPDLEQHQMGSILIIYEHEPFEPGSTIWVGINACDNAGNCMETFAFSFTVSDDEPPEDEIPPEVVFVHPPPGHTHVDVNAPVHFKIVDAGWELHGASGVDPDSLSLGLNGNEVPLELEPFGNGFIASYFHDEPFPEDTVIEVVINGCDNAGNCMEPFEYWFKTGEGGQQDEWPPYAFAETPPDGAEDVPVMADIAVNVVDFHEENGYGCVSGVDPDTVVMSVNGAEVDIELLELGEMGYRVIHHNEYGFDLGAVIEVGLEACDNAGNCMEPFHWSFTVGEGGEDTEPPAVIEPHPEPNQTDVPVDAPIDFMIIDEGVGVDPETIVMTVNGMEATNLEMEEVDDHGYHVFYNPPEDLPPDSENIVIVHGCDYNENCITFEWTFFTSPGPAAPPALIYPFNGAWMNYYLEDGTVKFSWSSNNHQNCFRLKFYLEGIPAPTVLDLSPDDYFWVFGMATLVYPVPLPSWDVISDLGPIAWEVAVIDHPGGQEITDYSEMFEFTMAPTDCVVLRTPEDFSVIGAEEPPIFSWDPDLNAAAYLIGLAQVGEDGEFLGDVYSGEIPHFITEIPLSQSSWDLIEPGYWLWTVLPIFENGHYGNFMIFHFTKADASMNNAPEFPDMSIRYASDYFVDSLLK